MIHNAIVLGGHTTALYAARSFGRAGAKVAIVDTVGTCEARFSRYCSAFHKVEQFTPEVLLATVNMIARSLGPCAIIPTSDAAVWSLSQILDALPQEHVPLIPPWHITEIAYDKRPTYALAQRCGVRRG